MLYHCKVCMHLFKVALGQILNNFPLFTCHFFPPVFKEVLVKDVFAGVVMIKHLGIKWCHLENNTTFSNSVSLSILLVSIAVTSHMSRKYTLTHYMAESTSGQDEASSVFWLAWLTELVQSRKLDITPVLFYIISELMPVMPTLPLLAGDLRFFASSPALLLWYINLPLFTSTINIEYLVKNKTALVWNLAHF